MGDRCLEILRDLLSFESFTTDGVNALARHIVDAYLKPAGVQYREIVSNNRINLLVSVNRDFTDDLSGGIVMSGHIDTVTGFIPVTETDGALYGRGAVDMKFFTAAVLSMIPYFKTLPYPVLFAFTTDEETAFFGINAIVDYCNTNGIKPKYCIVGEPTDMNLSLSNMGCKVWHTTFHGIAAHSSMPDKGSNAIETAVNFINLIKENPLINNVPDNTITYNIAKISGGVADNIIPDTCCVTYCFRFTNPAAEQTVNSVISQCLDKVSARVNLPMETVMKLYIKSFSNTTSPLADKITSVLPDLEYNAFFACTEAGYWHEYGVDTVIFGIAPIELAHKDNEHIMIDTLAPYCAELKKICDNI